MVQYSVQTAAQPPWAFTARWRACDHGCAPRDVAMVFVNPHAANRHHADSLEAMRERVAAEDWPGPYLRDESQEVASEFGAQVTPDVFVVDSNMRVRYRGAPDQDVA